MVTTLWKPLFVASILLTAAGCALFVWGISRNIPWQGAMIAVLVIIMGGLLARMNYRAYRYAMLPTPSTALPIIGVTICALLWIASVMGLR
ncbi:MAG TPA: hypothetical protein VF705_13990 [Longimicrobium sp.]|jgi:hypothetical protein